MRGPPVVLTNTLGRPVTNVISERGAVPMVVVNTLGEPVTLVAQGGEPVTLFNPNGTLWDYPFSLFSNNEQGAWYDPSDFSTLFQNAAGTTPVTAVEQPVRLMLDRSRGLVLGGELVTNGGFATDTDWTKGADWTIAAGVASKTAGTAAFLSQAMSLVAGRAYAVTFTATVSAGTIQPQFSTTTSVLGTARSASGTYTEILVAVTGNDTFRFLANSTFAGSIDNISVRELPGNHALAPNDASRPVLRARYNQVTYSEDFSNAAWGKTNATVTSGVADPFGGTKAFTLTATSNNGDILQSVSNPGGTAASITQAIWVRRRTGTGIVYLFNLNAGGITTITVTSSWQLFLLTGPGAASLAYAGLRLATSGDAVDIAFASLLTAADQTSTGGAYQRIAAATDYDTSNPVWRPYLAFDGSDDSMTIASSIHDVFQNVGAGTVWAGYMGVGTAQPVIGLTRGGSSANPRAYVYTNLATGRRLDADASASATDGAWAANGIYVGTNVSDWAGGNVIRRTNGAQVASTAYSSGAGNTENTLSQAALIGQISTSYLSGRLYSAIILGRAATTAELTATESWINGKTGAY